MRWLVERPVFRNRAGNRFLTSALLAVEQAIPIDRATFALVDSEKPDVLLVTPLVDIGSDQVDYVKAARRLGVRSALPVLSWDNLTNKGLIRVPPNQVLVWNEAQKAEAVTMHGTDPSTVVVTGAMVYDQWFARRAELDARRVLRPRRARSVAADPALPVLVAVHRTGRSQFHRAMDRRRSDRRRTRACARPGSSSGRIRRIVSRGIASPPEAMATSRCGRRGGASPVDAESKNDFFDSMYHAAGAVGINTSAQIECGIVGRPVFSIRTPAYQKTQEGTLHFRHLTSEGGGLLRLADDFAAHVQQIAAALDDPEGTRRQVEGFVKAFTRPHGLDVEATPRMVDAIEQLAAASRARSEGSAALRLSPSRRAVPDRACC